MFCIGLVYIIYVLAFFGLGFAWYMGTTLLIQKSEVNVQRLDKLPICNLK